MAKGVSHRGQLEQLRDHLREERRKAVQKLGTAPISSKNFTLARFVTRVWCSGTRNSRWN